MCKQASRKPHYATAYTLHTLSLTPLRRSSSPFERVLLAAIAIIVSTHLIPTRVLLKQRGQAMSFPLTMSELTA